MFICSQCVRFPLLLQKSFLAVQAPAIPAKAAIFSHYAMAGNDHCRRICGAGPGHGPDCFGTAYGLGNLSISAGMTIRNCLQCFINLPLKGSDLNIQREIQAR